MTEDKEAQMIAQMEAWMDGMEAKMTKMCGEGASGE